MSSPPRPHGGATVAVITIGEAECGILFCRVRSVAGLQHGRRQWVPHCEPFAPLRRSSDGCTHERSGEHVDAGQATEQEGVWHRENSDRHISHRVYVAVEVRSRPIREHPS